MKRSATHTCCALAWIALSGCSSPSSKAPPSSPPVYAVQPSGGHLVDPQGRTVILRGVNARAAGFFDIYKNQAPLPPFTADDCRVVGEEFGMNQLRLAINWSYLEPQRGSFDQAYVDKILKLAAACQSYGVATLVDLHQDAWSKYLGQDGAPFWAHKPPLPAADEDQRAGGQSVVAPDVQAAFAGFFGDHDGLVADYATMAAHLAKLIDHQPGVIGLELMNEPTASPSELDAFYAAVANAVRAVAPELPIYFEPNATRNILDVASPDPVPVSGVVYAPHLYTGVFQGTWQIGQDSRIDDSVTKMLSEAKSVNASLMVTEFGNNPVEPTGSAWIAAALTTLDAHAVSASFWVYEEWPSTCGSPTCWGLYDEAPATDGGAQTSYDRTLRPAAVTLLARAFPQAIAGELDAFSYDPSTRTLTVQMHGAAGTDVLAAPDLIYASGVRVTCDGHEVKATRSPGRVDTECAGTSLVMSPAP
jgi:endoglycosylceramidase